VAGVSLDGDGEAAQIGGCQRLVDHALWSAPELELERRFWEPDRRGVRRPAEDPPGAMAVQPPPVSGEEDGPGAVPWLAWTRRPGCTMRLAAKRGLP
jgi:hypothetical protein